jgi:predicted nucleotidyltransferase
MRRAEVIEKLKANADVIRSFGVENLFLCGSHARDEATPTSDIDLFFGAATRNRGVRSEGPVMKDELLSGGSKTK